ncbi:hypothetical protein NDU88_000978 [Pleurodeles waltl]|uniref:Uncharacterized protein n=1 Tax=Pleurodeles waltl TaxID=8319 RepID=A0AAV7NC52_PLEWA|nr:hypothetical protein NDU88_000978 [Pleurodeles waltl]
MGSSELLPLLMVAPAFEAVSPGSPVIGLVGMTCSNLIACWPIHQRDHPNPNRIGLPRKSRRSWLMGDINPAMRSYEATFMQAIFLIVFDRNFDGNENDDCVDLDLGNHNSTVHGTVGAVYCINEYDDDDV